MTNPPILAGIYSLLGGSNSMRKNGPETPDDKCRIVKKLRFNEGMFPSDPLKLYLDGDIDEFRSGSDFLVGNGWGWLAISPYQEGVREGGAPRHLQIVDYDIFIGEEGILLPKLSYFRPEERGYHGSIHFDSSYSGMNPFQKRALDRRVDLAMKNAVQLDENRLNVGKRLVKVLEERLPKLSGQKQELCELLLASQNHFGEEEKERTQVVMLDSYLG